MVYEGFWRSVGEWNLRMRAMYPRARTTGSQATGRAGLCRTAAKAVEYQRDRAQLGKDRQQLGQV